MVPIREITYTQLKNVNSTIRAITRKDFGNDTFLSSYRVILINKVDEALKSVVIRNSDETVEAEN